MSHRSTKETTTGAAFLRAQLGLPSLILLLALAYELFGKGRVVAPESWAARIIDLLLLISVGLAMAWWGTNLAKSLLQRLARSEAASDEKNRLLEQRNRQLQILLQASRSMAGVLDFNKAARTVVEQAVAHTRFTKACLVLGPDMQGAYEAVAATGLSPDHLERLTNALHSDRSSSPVEWCRVTRQPVVIENIIKDFRLAGQRELYAGLQLQGLIATPLLQQERFIGSLILYEESSESVSTAEISLITALAGQAVLALENARLHTRVVKDYQRLDDAGKQLECVASALGKSRVSPLSLVQFVAQAVARLFAPAVVAVHVSRGGRAHPTLVVEGSGATDELVRSVRLGMEAQDESAEPRSKLKRALALDDACFGSFQLYIPDQSRQLSPQEELMVQTFIHLTASGLGNAALMADMRSAIEEVERAYMGTLEALTKALELRDHETEGHSRRVVQYTLALSQKLGVAESQLVPIMRGALLHDIGKIGIPDAILKKPGPLDEAEWTIMRQHAEIGYQMLQRIDFLKQATPIIRHHHERYDGKGYPTGLAGAAIPLGARVFAVADAYDAITSDRPYRKGRSHEAALEIISAETGKQFDDQVVSALMALPAEELSRIRGRDLDFVRE